MTHMGQKQQAHTQDNMEGTHTSVALLSLPCLVLCPLVPALGPGDHDTCCQPGLKVVAEPAWILLWTEGAMGMWTAALRSSWVQGGGHIWTLSWGAAHPVSGWQVREAEVATLQSAGLSDPLVSVIMGSPLFWGPGVPNSRLCWHCQLLGTAMALTAFIHYDRVWEQYRDQGIEIGLGSVIDLHQPWSLCF